jgi:hypothetical protein
MQSVCTKPFLGCPPTPSPAAGIQKRPCIAAAPRILSRCAENPFPLCRESFLGTWVRGNLSRERWVANCCANPFSAQKAWDSNPKSLGATRRS